MAGPDGGTVGGLDEAPGVGTARVFVCSSRSLCGLFVASSDFVPQLTLGEATSPSLDISEDTFADSILSSGSFVSSAGPFTPSTVYFTFTPCMGEVSVFLFSMCFPAFS